MAQSVKTFELDEVGVDAYGEEVGDSRPTLPYIKLPVGVCDDDTPTLRSIEVQS